MIKNLGDLCDKALKSSFKIKEGSKANFKIKGETPKASFNIKEAPKICFKIKEEAPMVIFKIKESPEKIQ